MTSPIVGTVTQIVKNLQDFAIVKGAIRTGAGSIYQSLSGLFSSERPIVSHKPLETQSIFTSGKVPDDKTLLNTAPFPSADRFQLTVPEEATFLDAKTDGKNAHLKREIAGKIANLLEALNDTDDIRQRSISNFARIIGLLRRHGLYERDAENFRFGHRLINIIIPKISAATGDSIDARIQDAILFWLEGDIDTLLEQQTWEYRETDLLKAWLEDDFEVLLKQEVKTTITSTLEFQLGVSEADFFRDAKTGEEEARQKWEISQQVANLLQALNATDGIRQKSTMNFYSIISMLREHGLEECDNQNISFDVRLRGLIANYYGPAMASGSNAGLQYMILDRLENSISIEIEQASWIAP